MGKFNLTELETQLFILIAQKFTIAQIMRRLKITQYEYYKNIKSVISKTGARNRQNALILLLAEKQIYENTIMK